MTDYARPVGSGWVHIQGSFTIPNGMVSEVLIDPKNPGAGTRTITSDAVYAHNWLEAASPDELAAIGAVEILPAVSPDEGFQYVEGSFEVGDLDGAPIWIGPVEALPAPETPFAIDMRQARLMLVSEPHGEGTRLDAVEAFMAAQPRAAQIEWEYARELRRDHPLVAIMGLFFGLDVPGLDQWFRDAAAIGPTVTA